MIRDAIKADVYIFREMTPVKVIVQDVPGLVSVQLIARIIRKNNVKIFQPSTVGGFFIVKSQCAVV